MREIRKQIDQKRGKQEQRTQNESAQWWENKPNQSPPSVEHTQTFGSCGCSSSWQTLLGWALKAGRNLNKVFAPLCSYENAIAAKHAGGNLN